MKKVIRSVSLFLLAICIVLSASLIPGVIQDSDDCVSAIAFPVLTASIGSPANGSIVETGKCFQVTATVTATCPNQITSNGYFYPRPVYADDCTPAASSVSATMTIQGNAQIQGNATQQSSATLYCSGSGCQSTVTFTWQVCCTGEGATTITVTPAGELPFEMRDGGAIGIAKFVFARLSSPFPAENLISDSITITQRESFYQKMKKDQASPTWSRPSSMTTVNTWTQTQTARAGQEVVIFANVANRGDIEGPYTATLKVNGVVEEVKTGMLQGNTAIPLKFVVTRDQPGTYNVDVNGQQTFFTVIGDSSQSALADSRPTGMIVLMIVLVALIAVLLTLIVIRRTATR